MANLYRMKRSLGWVFVEIYKLKTAIKRFLICDPYGNRTRIYAVRGRRPNR